MECMRYQLYWRTPSNDQKLFISYDREDKRLQDIVDKAMQAHIDIEKLSMQK